MNQKQPYFVAFHSLSGGLGKTTTLTKMAEILSDEKYELNILALDLSFATSDLQYRELFNNLKGDSKSTGFINFLKENRSVFDQKERKNYNLLTTLSKLIVPTHKYSNLSIIPAYPTAPPKVNVNSNTMFAELPELLNLSDIHWHNFYDQKKIGFYFMKALKDYLKEYDYVLMDVDSGFVNLAQMATLQLADMIISFLRTDEKYIEKTKEHLDQIKNIRKRLFKPIPDLYFVASGVMSEIDKAMLEEPNFEEDKVITIPFDSTEKEKNTSYKMLSLPILFSPRYTKKFENKRIAYAVNVYASPERHKNPLISLMSNLKYERNNFNKGLSTKKIKKNLDMFAMDLLKIGKEKEHIFCKAITLIKSTYFREVLEKITDLDPSHKNYTFQFVSHLIDGFKNGQNLEKLKEIFIETVNLYEDSNNKDINNKDAVIDKKDFCVKQYRKNGWFYAAVFAVIDTINQSIKNKAIDPYQKIKEFLTHAINEDELKGNKTNKFRPGMKYEAGCYYWGNIITHLKSILDDRKLKLVYGYSGTGKTWGLQIIEFECLKNKELKTYFLDGKIISDEMEKEGTRPLFENLKKAIDQLCDIENNNETFSDFKDLIPYIRNNQKIDQLKKSVLFFDDIDVCLEKIKKEIKYDTHYQNLRYLFTKIPLKLLCASMSLDFYEKDKKNKTSIFPNLFNGFELKRVSKKQKDSDEKVTDKQFIKIIYPILENYELVKKDTQFTDFEYQAIGWGNHEWKTISEKATQ